MNTKSIPCYTKGMHSTDVMCNAKMHVAKKFSHRNSFINQEMRSSWLIFGHYAINPYLKKNAVFFI